MILTMGFFGFDCTLTYPRLVVHDKHPLVIQAELHFLRPDACGLLQLQQPPHAIRRIHNSRFLVHGECGQMFQKVCGLVVQITIEALPLFTTTSIIARIVAPTMGTSAAVAGAASAIRVMVDHIECESFLVVDSAKSENPNESVKHLCASWKAIAQSQLAALTQFAFHIPHAKQARDSNAIILKL